MLCTRCGVRRGRHTLSAGGVVPKPNQLCCACTDAVMVELSATVPADEGARGLASFRADHWSQCGFVVVERACPS